MLQEDLIHHELPTLPIPSDQLKDDLDLYSSLFSTPGGAPPDGDPKQSIRAELLSHLRAKYLEILSYLSGSFAIAEAAHPRPSFPASKGHLALYWPQEGGTDHLATLIQLISGQLNADFIRLDAQDLAELGSDLVSSDDSVSHKSISTLGYDTYEQTQESESAEEEEDGDDADPREAEENSKARGFAVMPGFQIPKDTIRGISNFLQSQGLLRRGGFSSIPLTAITIDGVGALSMHDATDNWKLGALLEAVIDAAMLKRKKAEPLGSSTLSPAQIQRAEFHKALFAKATAGNLDFLFGRAPKEAQASDNESKRPVLEAAVTRQEGKLPKRTVVFIPDFMDLSATPQGSRVISQLVDIVQQRRNAGEQMVIVGASASLDLDMGTAAEVQRRLNDESEVSRFRALLMSLTSSNSQPSMIQTSQSKADLLVADTSHDKTRTVSQQTTGGSMRKAYINWRNICHMLGQMIPRKTDLDRFSPPPLSLEYISQEILSRDEVHQVAITAIGLHSISRNGDISGKPLDSVPITEAFLLLEMSHWAPDSSRVTQKNPGEESKSAEFQTSKLTTQSIESRMASIRETGNRYEKRLLSGVVLPRKISTTFEDVHVTQDTIEAVKTLTSLSLQRPEAFKYGVLKSDTIPGLLLYGPPGTGKTLLARAVAKESGATVLRVSGSDVNQMYVGESEKTVKAIFSLARKLSPCIVFIDEADSIFASRSMSRHRPAHRDTINQFLQEWDGMEDLSVFLMVATNRPFDLDDAVLRRLPRRLLIDLPDSSSREAILRIHLKGEVLDSDVSLSTLASETSFYSGSDLKNLAVAAALAAVREENELAALSPDFKYPEQRTLKKEHFEKAKQEISASISEDMQSLNAIRKFDEEFGSGNRRKRNAWGFGIREERKEGDVRVRP